MPEIEPVEVQDEVQQHDPATQSQATGDASPQDASGHVDGISQDGSATDGSAALNEGDAHPLEPDGKRFKQVWARAKTAEQEKDLLKAELQREREERIRYEERLKAAEEAKQKATQPEYTWEQLESFIADGKITRAQANEYREKLVEERALAKAQKAFEAKQSQVATESTVVSQIERYKQLLPEVNTPGTPERQRVEREYAFLTQQLGYKPDLNTQLAALRAAVGDVDTVERTVQAKRTSQAQREPYMETQSTGGRPAPKAKDPVATLSPEKKAHYEHMIKTGRYGGWDDVRKELEFVPPSLAPKRR